MALKRGAPPNFSRLLRPAEGARIDQKILFEYQPLLRTNLISGAKKLFLVNNRDQC